MKTREEIITEIRNTANYKHSFGENSRIEGEVSMAQKAFSVIDELQNQLSETQARENENISTFIEACVDMKDLREENQLLKEKLEIATKALNSVINQMMDIVRLELRQEQLNNSTKSKNDNR